MSNILDKNFWLFTTPIAHRGLADTTGYVENTLPAFINSMQKGYAIETDLRLDKEGNIVCFHDDNLSRLTNGELNNKICHLTNQEIAEIKLINGQKICTFLEFLSHINGKVPLVIELKNGEDLSLADKSAGILKEYKGDFVIKSFDPRLVKRFKKLLPNSVCGQLIGGTNHPKLDKIKWSVINAFTKPQFISHNIDTLVNPYKNTICWTIRNKEQFLKAKSLGLNVIFEGEENIK